MQTRSKATILVVDDEPDLLENIELMLEAEGYGVITAGDGLEALVLLQTQPVNLILADIAMPHMNGYQLYERVRANPQWTTIPFVFLTARKLDSDIRYGKELGVDDYLVKPFRAWDLLAIVRGKLHRAQQLARMSVRPNLSKSEGNVLNAGQLRIHLGQHRVWWIEREIKLSAREFALLEYLVRQKGNAVSPQELIKHTHDLETDPVEAGALVRPLIFSLRRKLGLSNGKGGYIENVRGVGYRLAISEE